MMLFVALATIFLVVAMTRPGPNRLFRGRYRRPTSARSNPRTHHDATLGLRDPARRL
jgi:hypothetical protein